MRPYFAGFVTGAALALAAALVAGRGAPRPAEAQERRVEGAGDAGAVEERIRWKTEAGSGQSAHLRRVLVKVPRGYGSLVQATGGDGTTVLWFQGQESVLRNVVLREAGALYQVEYE